MTGLKAAYSNILKPSAEAAKYAKSIGLNFSASHMKSVGWAKMLQEIKEKTGGNAEKMGKLFGSTEALNSIMVLAGKGSKDFNEAMKQMNKSTGATDKAYRKMLTPSEKMSISTNKMKNSLIKLGGALSPVVSKVAAGVGKIADKLGGMNGKQAETIVKVAGVVAAVGPAVMIFGKVVKTVGGAIKIFGVLQKSIVKAGSVMGLLTSPTAIVIGVLAAIVVVGILVWKNFDKIKKYAMKLKNAVVSAFKSSGASTKIFSKAFKSMKKTVGAIVNNLGVIFKKIIKFLKPVAKFVITGFVNKIKVGFSAAVGFVSGFATGAQQYIKGILKAFKGITTFISGVFCGDWKKAFNGLKEFFSGWGTAVVGLVKMPVNGIIGLVNGAIAGINKLHLKIPKWVPGVGGKEFGVHVGKIPMLYRGTNNWQGGIASINERGGEIVDLPKGTRVYPHDKSVRMARNEGKGKGGIIVKIAKIADKVVIREEADLDKLADKFGQKIKETAINMGVS